MTHATRLLARLGTLGALVILAGCGGAQSRLATHMERGNSFFEKGDYAKAGIEFRNALQVQPKFPDALFMSARVAEQRGNYRDAVGLYTAAVDAKPDYEQARVNLARLYVLGGLPEDGLKAAEAGLRIFPGSADLITMRGTARHELNDNVGALDDASRAVHIAPANETAVGLLAGLETDSGDLKGAIALLNDAVARVPTSVGLRELLANLYVSAAQADKAEEQMRRLIDLQPGKFEPRFGLALLLTRNHQVDDAQRVLEAAVTALPKDDGAKLALVDFLVAQRSSEQGQKTLHDFIARQPENYELRFGLARVFQQGNDSKQAIATYNEIISLNGTHANGLVARDRIAALQVASHDYQPALKLVDEVLAENPHDSEALVVRASAALATRNATDAIRDLRAVLRDQPNSVPLQRMLARAYVANGQPQLAEEAFRTTLELDPNDTQTKLEFAQLLLQTQRSDQAVTLLEETVRRSPADVGARETLVRAYLAKGNFDAAHLAATDLETLQPQSASAAYLAGIVAQRQNRLADSEHEFERALKIQPDAMDALAGLATLQLQRGEGAAAVARVQSLVTADPNNPGTRNLLGELFIATRAFPQANEQFSRAVVLAPGWWVPYRGLMGAKVATGDLPGAIAVCEAGLKRIPFDPSLTQQLAALYERQGRVDEAIARYDALLAHDPHIDFAASNLALLLVAYRTDHHDLERARELTARFESSSDGALLDTHGWVRYKGGDVPAALASLERAADRAPDSKVIRYHLAMAQLKSGQRERAVGNLESALSGSVSFSGSEQARATLADLKHSSG